MIGDSLSLAAFRERASALTDTALSQALQLDTSTSSPLEVQTRAVQVPVDAICPAGFYCSAAASYACPRGTWNNLTGQADSSKCLTCPTPERMTTLEEGSTSVDACVCISSYYQGPDGSCLVCPVGSDCGEPGVALDSLPVIVGYFRPSNASIDIRRCPDASENCGGRDDCAQSSSGCRGTLNGSSPCGPTLEGILCQTCQGDDRYYVAASGKDTAVCKECNDTLGTSLGIAAAVLVSLVVLRTIIYLTHQQLSDDHKEAIRDAHRKLRLDNKLKILVGFYMIATQVGSVYEVRLPQDVQQLLSSMSVVVTLGIDLGLRTTPLACFGLPGYIPQLLFWMITPLFLVGLILVGAVVLASREAEEEEKQTTRWAHAVLFKAAPVVLRLLFLVYPIVTQEAFKAFSCYEFDEGSPSATGWLRADVSIECGSDEHAAAEGIALLAILMYPVCLTGTFAVLLIYARDAIISSTKTKLSKALRFLYCEFETRFFWWGKRRAAVLEPCPEHPCETRHVIRQCFIFCSQSWSR